MATKPNGYEENGEEAHRWCAHKATQKGTKRYDWSKDSEKIRLREREGIAWPRGETKFLFDCWKIFHEWTQWTSEIFSTRTSIWRESMLGYLPFDPWTTSVPQSYKPLQAWWFLLELSSPLLSIVNIFCYYLRGKQMMMMKLTVSLELRSRKTVRFSEQITSADKYPSIFPRQMEAIVYMWDRVFID